MNSQQLDTPTRIALEGLYSILLSAIVHLARVLGKPSPIKSRAERLQERDYLRNP